MARVTVEDCIVKVPNRFELVLLAAQRARAIAGGAPITVDRDNDKDPVVALREIAEGTVDLESIRQNILSSMKGFIEQDEPEGEDELAQMIQRELSAMAGADAESQADSGAVNVVDASGEASLESMEPEAEGE